MKASSTGWRYLQGVFILSAADYAERRLRGHCDDTEELLAALAPGAEERLAAAQERAEELRRRDDVFPDVLSAVATARSDPRSLASG